MLRIVSEILGVGCVVLVWNAAAVEISTETPCAVFVDGQLPRFRVSGAAGGSWRATDWRGKMVGDGRIVEDGEVLPPAPDRGYYEFSVMDKDGNASKHSYFIVPDPQTRKSSTNSFYAVDSAFTGLGHCGRFACPWYGGDSYRMTMEMMRLAGIRYTRERMEWSKVQPKANKPPKFGNNLINERKLKEMGIGVSGIFHDCPEWVEKMQKLPANLVEVYRFAETCAREFGDTVQDWEFWNEPDIGFAPEPAWDYASALKAATLGFRAGNPKVLLLNGALCHADRNAYDTTLFANRISKYMDVFNFHTYDPLGRYPKIFGSLRGFLDRYDVSDRQIWVTESGSNAEGHCAEIDAKTGNGRHSPWQELLWTEFYPKSQAYMQMEGVYRNYLFVFSAYNERGGKKDWGVIRRDGTLKPIFAAISTMTFELGSAQLEGEVNIGSDAKAFLFRDEDGSRTLLAWKISPLDSEAWRVSDMSAPRKMYTVPVQAGKYNLIDMCGGCRQETAGPRGLRVMLDRFPTYIRGVSEMPILRKAENVGVAAPKPEGGDDLSVVLRVEYDKDAFGVMSSKSSLITSVDKAKMNIQVWNLSAEAKRGKVVVRGAKISGVPMQVDLPAWGKVDIPVEFIGDPTMINGSEGVVCMEVGGMFNKRRITPACVPIYDLTSLKHNFKSVNLAIADSKQWKLKQEADRQSCRENKEEGGICFEYGWDSTEGEREFFPRYVLRADEDAEGAVMIEFEIKSKQDKIENDYSKTMMLLGFDGKDDPNWYCFEAPGEGWEQRHFDLKAIMAKHPGKKLTSIRFGGRPRGNEVKFYLRNVKIYKGK